MLISQVKQNVSFMKLQKKPNYFLLDVDGVLNTGQFIYNSKGKFGKIFGADDNDALKILSNYIKIEFITSDKKGLKITKKRVVTGMGFKLNFVPNNKRLEWIKKNVKKNVSIYMGDGLFDWILMKNFCYTVSCKNSNEITRKYSHYITKNHSGERAVSEACYHILKKFFVGKNLEKIISNYYKKL